MPLLLKETTSVLACVCEMRERGVQSRLQRMYMSWYVHHHHLTLKVSHTRIRIQGNALMLSSMLAVSIVGAAAWFYLRHARS